MAKGSLALSFTPLLQMPPLQDKDDLDLQQNKPWHNVSAQRLACASPPLDNSFCMEVRAEEPGFERGDTRHTRLAFWGT